ncbi:SDR family NAD(P)-dependent oxidoreductase [Falsirhodobacter sp. 20TX0035]|uniref:SDR family NAD(P)-dependent oxidoreductase n=1 Tax=Falsirhodobacter sp. 20TX0035 TaxID=3022019 RepID=UPI00232C7B72|nr:SDR family oxidoreductase [Falsirhodobacter sp. 20TX0035]MDB6454348.1 SDR family oxidoreductase [Falsirhodobacter sp. 20TX0035]
MDLGIHGKTALVCAGSKGLGYGCAEALAAAGVNLILNARTEGPLEEAAERLRRHGVEVRTVAADIATEEGQRTVLAVAGEVDILVNNAGGPPPGVWSDWGRADFQKALDANMLAPIAMMTAIMPKMIEKGWGRVVNITSQSVRAPIAQLGLSNAARTGLTGYVAGTSRQVAPHGVIVNNLLPGTHATARSESLDKGRAAREGVDEAEARRRSEAEIPAGHYGDAGDFGAICAFLCSQQARFIVGQNILVDGGNVNLTM